MLQTELVTGRAAVLGHGGFFAAGEEADIEVLALLAEGEDEALCIAHLETGVEQQFFFLVPGGEQQATGGAVPEGDGEDAAQAQAGLVAVFGADDEALAV
ncbi:MAG: hypothetical protein Q7S46_04925 [Gallionella sp.]|nr:hypothetical protein [Gallionella sp.]